VYRWTLIEPELIRLEHLRFGPDRPVLLFDLAPDSDEVWISVTPHVCDQDCYTAKLRLDKDTIFLEWTVSGSTKQETIRYEYN
jgi:hypothetical protein